MLSPRHARAALAWRAQQKLTALCIFPLEGPSSIFGHCRARVLQLMAESDGGGGEDDIEVAGVALRPLFRL